MKRDQPRLPKEPADLFTQPIARFLKIEAASGLLLLLATVTALGLANSTWSAGFLEFWETPIGHAQILLKWLNAFSAIPESKAPLALVRRLRPLYAISGQWAAASIMLDLFKCKDGFRSLRSSLAFGC